MPANPSTQKRRRDFEDAEDRPAKKARLSGPRMRGLRPAIQTLMEQDDEEKKTHEEFIYVFQTMLSFSDFSNTNVLDRNNETDCITFLENNPKLADAVLLFVSAVNKANFDADDQESEDCLERVVTHSALNNNRPTRHDKAEDMNTNRRAWKSPPFRGKYHAILFNIINEMNKTRGNSPYANNAPIIQSSGCGKSSTVDEVAQDIFTFPACLRPNNWTVKNEGEDGYHPGDVVLYKLLIEGPRSGITPSFEDVILYYRLCLVIMLEEAASMQHIWKGDTEKESARKWRDYLENNREFFYNEVASKVRKLWFDESVREGLLDRASNAAKQLIRAITGDKNQAIRANGDIKVLIYLDEVHHMSDEEIDGFALSALFENALNTWIMYPIFTLFISKASGLSTLAPTKERIRSSRILANDGAYLQPPITEMPFDVWSGPNGDEPIIVEDTKTLEEVCTVGFMVRFGRPLFFTRWENAPDDLSRRQLFRFAKEKIQGPTKRRDNATDYHILAALGIRVLLDFDTRKGSVEAEKLLVDNHMRVANSVPIHRRYLRSGAPSEPVLAEAAALILHEDARFRSANSWAKYLTDNQGLGLGICSKDDIGGLVMRMLLTAAHDRAVEHLNNSTISTATATATSNAVSEETATHTDPDPSPLPDVTLTSNVEVSLEPEWDRGIPLADFLRALLGNANGEKVLKSRPKNVVSGDTLEEAFIDARVRFTHFVRSYDSSTFTDDVMWAAIARGYAIQCWSNQWLIDLILPILLWNRRLGRYVMTALFIQGNNSLTAQRPYANIEGLKFFSHLTEEETFLSDTEEIREEKAKKVDESRTRPYIVLIANVGIGRKTSEGTALGVIRKQARIQGRKTTDKYKIKPSPRTISEPATLMEHDIGATLVAPHLRQSSQMDSAEKIHPCYEFTIDGCSPAVYEVIDEDGKDVWALLLGTQDPMDERSRHEEVPIRAFLRSGPEVSPGLDSYSWVGQSSKYSNTRLGSMFKPASTMTESATGPAMNPSISTSTNVSDGAGEEEDVKEGVYATEFSESLELIEVS